MSLDKRVKGTRGACCDSNTIRRFPATLYHLEIGPDHLMNRLFPDDAACRQSLQCRVHGLDFAPWLRRTGPCSQPGILVDETSRISYSASGPFGSSQRSGLTRGGQPHLCSARGLPSPRTGIALRRTMLNFRNSRSTNVSVLRRGPGFLHSSTAALLILIGTLTPGLPTTEGLESSEVEWEECEAASLGGVVRSQRTSHAKRSRTNHACQSIRSTGQAVVMATHGPIGHCFGNGLRAPLVC